MARAGLGLAAPARRPRPGGGGLGATARPGAPDDRWHAAGGNRGARRSRGGLRGPVGRPGARPRVRGWPCAAETSDGETAGACSPLRFGRRAGGAAVRKPTAPWRL